MRSIASRRKCASGLPRFAGLRDVNTDLYMKNPELTRRDRPREGSRLRHLDRPGPAGTLQRFRLPAGRDHLHADQRLPDHPGEKPEYQVDISGLSKIYVNTSAPNLNLAAGGCVTGNSTPTGQAIPLSAVTTLVPTVGPLQVNHQGQQPAVTHLVQPRARLFARPSRRRDPADRARLQLAGVDHDRFQGNAQVFQEFAEGQGILILAAIFAAYVVLGILYESFIHPITIISGLPRRASARCSC